MPPLVHIQTENADSPKGIQRGSTREMPKKAGLPQDMPDFVSLLMGMFAPSDGSPPIPSRQFQEGLQEDRFQQTAAPSKAPDSSGADVPQTPESQDLPHGILTPQNESPDSQDHHPGMNPREEAVSFLNSGAEAFSAEPAFSRPLPGTPSPVAPAPDPPVPTATQAHLQSPVAVEPRLPEPVPVAVRFGVHFDPQNILEQVGGKIVSWIRGSQGTRNPGDQVIKIQLQPESLGRLEVKISMTDNQISTSIVTESALVKDLIQSHQHWLNSALTEQGFKMSDFSVTVGHQGSGGSASPWTPSEGGKNGSRDEQTLRRPAWTAFRGMEGRGASPSLMNGGVNIFA